MKVVIVGGVAGGATAAARIRRLDENAEIMVFERTGFVSYANCGLPYFIGGVIQGEENLTLQTPESFFNRFRVNMKVHHEVMKINKEQKTVTVKNLQTGEVFDESYDKLILSPGAKPTVPATPGADSKRVFSLRTVEDTLAIDRFIKENKVEKVAVIGGGFIGIEIAENFVHLGLETILLQRSAQLLPPFDLDMAAFVHNKMRAGGVDLRLNTKVPSMREEGDKLVLETDLGEEIPVDMLVFAIGVTPDTGLAFEAGLELGMKGAIVVNDRMETSEADIFAVGDAVEVKHLVTGDKAVISLAGPANKQGRIVADNICGGDSRFKGSQGSSVIKVFDMTAAATGINEKTAKASGIDYEKVVLSPLNHAGYYPGGMNMTLKVIYERETLKLLGAQIMGFDGVDKRIDVIATAIGGGIKANELVDLDLAYAPPYSSAKDPVNMAGFMIDNIEAGRVKQFYYDQVDQLPRDGSVTLLDSRFPFECMYGMAEGFVNIPLDEIRDRMDEIPKDKPVYVMCQSGLRSYLACRILSQNGYDCYNLSGGYGFYQSVKLGLRPCNTFECGVLK